jgi:hypothetical protein
MPRKPLIEYAGTVCHAVNREDRVLRARKDELDYKLFLSNMGCCEMDRLSRKHLNRRTETTC